MIELDLLESSLMVQLAISFTAGLLTFFTPCVYPMVPITIAMFGESNSTFRNSWFYALGIATTYSLIGALAGQGSIFFGSYMSNWWFLAFTSLVLFTLLLNLVGIFNIPLFYHLQNIGSKIKATGAKGCFLSGLLSGLIAAPCICPTLVAIIILSASHKSSLAGSVLLSFHALGLSLPFVFLARFSGLICKLPNCGIWLNWVKGAVSAGLVLTIFYLFSGHVDWFLTQFNNRLGAGYQNYFYFIFLVLSLGIFSYSNKYEKPFFILTSVFFISIVAYRVFLFSPAIDPANQLPWNRNMDSLINSTQISIVKTTAKWCYTCKELDEKTLSSKEVQEKLKKFNLVKVDMTDMNSSATSFSNKYDVLGVPTLLFINQNGEEIKKYRLVGFITAKQLINQLDKVLQYEH